MAIRIIDEAKRCLNYKKPKCMEGCPVDTSIPHIIKMLKKNVRSWMLEKNCSRIT